MVNRKADPSLGPFRAKAYTELPEAIPGYTWCLKERLDAEWSDYELIKDIHFDKSAPYWLRRQEEQKTVTGAREETYPGWVASNYLTEKEWKTNQFLKSGTRPPGYEDKAQQKYAEWFEKESSDIKRTRPNTLPVGETRNETAPNPDSEQGQINALRLHIVELERKFKRLSIPLYILVGLQAFILARGFFGW